MYAYSLSGRILVVKGPELLAGRSQHSIVRTYSRSRYLAWRIEKPMLFYVASSCLILPPCIYEYCTSLYKSNVPVPVCMLYHPPYFMLRWVGNLQPQKASLGRMDAPAHAWHWEKQKVKQKMEKREILKGDSNSESDYSRDHVVRDKCNGKSENNGWLSACLSNEWQNLYGGLRTSTRHPKFVSRDSLR